MRRGVRQLDKAVERSYERPLIRDMMMAGDLPDLEATLLVATLPMQAVA
jgi:hypothetical protein